MEVLNLQDRIRYVTLQKHKKFNSRAKSAAQHALSITITAF